MSHNLIPLSIQLWWWWWWEGDGGLGTVRYFLGKHVCLLPLKTYSFLIGSVEKKNCILFECQIVKNTLSGTILFSDFLKNISLFHIFVYLDLYPNWEMWVTLSGLKKKYPSIRFPDEHAYPRNIRFIWVPPFRNFSQSPWTKFTIFLYKLVIWDHLNERSEIQDLIINQNGVIKTDKGKIILQPYMYFLFNEMIVLCFMCVISKQWLWLWRVTSLERIDAQ